MNTIENLNELFAPFRELFGENYLDIICENLHTVLFTSTYYINPEDITPDVKDNWSNVNAIRRFFAALKDKQIPDFETLLKVA